MRRGITGVQVLGTHVQLVIAKKDADMLGL